MDKMILAKNEKGELCLIGNQSLEYYLDYKPIKVLDLPIQLKRVRCGDTLQDIKAKQLQLRDKALEELELRHNLIEILDNLEKE